MKLQDTYTVEIKYHLSIVQFNPWCIFPRCVAWRRMQWITDSSPKLVLGHYKIKWEIKESSKTRSPCVHSFKNQMSNTLFLTKIDGMCKVRRLQRSLWKLQKEKYQMSNFGLYGLVRKLTYIVICFLIKKEKPVLTQIAERKLSIENSLCHIGILKPLRRCNLKYFCKQMDNWRWDRTNWIVV